MIETITQENRNRVLRMFAAASYGMDYLNWVGMVEGYLADDRWLEVFFCQESRNALMIHVYEDEEDTVPQHEVTIFVDPTDHPYRITRQILNLFA